jgi:uncharacterized membrane protein
VTATCVNLTNEPGKIRQRNGNFLQAVAEGDLGPEDDPSGTRPPGFLELCNGLTFWQVHGAALPLRWTTTIIPGSLPMPEHRHPAPSLDVNPRFDTQRLLAFSDGVLAIIITLLVLDLRAPIAAAGSVSLAAEILHMWPNLAAFLVSFLLVGVVWMNHHSMFRHIERGDHALLVINLLLLLCVALIPFAAAIVSDNVRAGDEARQTAALLYGSVLVIGGIFFNAIWWYAVRAGLSSRPQALRQMGRHFLLGPGIYGVATLIAFISAIAALALYAILILYFAVSPLWAGRMLAPRRPRGVD